MMKVFPIIVAILGLLALALLSVFGWFWYHNQQSINPLPIAISERQLHVESPSSTTVMPAESLVLQIDDRLKPAMTQVLSQFERRYPNTKLRPHYVSRNQMFNLNHNPFSIDMIISDQRLSQSQLNLLQQQADQRPNTPSTSKTLAELTPFRYALKSQQPIEGVIVTDNSVAIQLRNFLLSSTGQTILTQNGFEDIDGYNNQIDDLFNPKMDINSKSNSAIDVKDVLKNEK